MLIALPSAAVFAQVYTPPHYMIVPLALLLIAGALQISAKRRNNTHTALCGKPRIGFVYEEMFISKFLVKIYERKMSNFIRSRNERVMKIHCR